jgi:hypothetical protein
MPSIEHYTIIKPPTSREVLEDALACISSRQALSLVMVSESDITPTDRKHITVGMKIRTTAHPEGEHTTITGTATEPFDEEIGSIVLSIPDSDLPATADVVNR